MFKFYFKSFGNWSQFQINITFIFLSLVYLILVSINKTWLLILFYLRHSVLRSLCRSGLGVNSLRSLSKAVISVVWIEIVIVWMSEDAICTVESSVVAIVFIRNDWIQFHILKVNFNLSSVLSLKIFQFLENIFLCLIDKVNYWLFSFVGNKSLNSLV